MPDDPIEDDLGSEPDAEGRYVCARCSKAWLHDRNHCGHCGGILIALAPEPPQQDVWFVIPPRPEPTYYRLEWRWKARVQRQLSRVIDPSVIPANDWNVHSTHYWVSVKSESRRIAARLRRQFPGKSFRVVPVWA